MNEQYTFETLTSSDIHYSEEISVKIEKVVIPRIQRPYAQGRKGETETRIRKEFIGSIFEHLKNNTTMDLHFLYGAVRKDEHTGIWQLELLDGQQRFTTLYLLHWYLLNRERAAIEETREESILKALKSFVYETRSTSSEFCKSFVDFKYNFDESNLIPSEAIKKTRWYYNRFDNDSTVMGMLVMLDYIHEKYNEFHQSGLFSHINCLRFYLLPLFGYTMQEDLYIKMNARGLSLTPFDNFKADFTGAMKKSNALNDPVDTPDGFKVSHRESIEIKLDAKWIDIFWSPERDDYHKAYMLFFSRFFAYKYIVDSITPANSMTDKNLPINIFFTQSENNRGEYLGFEKYQEALKNHSEYFTQIEKILDTISDEQTLDIIHNSLKPIWENITPNNFFILADAHFSQSLLVVFGAICDFILHFDKFDDAIFKQWMRIVHNVVENTNIDSLIAATGPLRNLHALINQANSSNFFNSIANAKPTSGSTWPGAIAEEIEKARRIDKDNCWLDEFIKAEKHLYLKGSIRFFYDNNLTIDEFKHNRDLVIRMFDEKGITEQFRDKHILIRAIMSHLKQWNKAGLENRYITENADSDKRLKLLLLENEEIRKMFVICLKQSVNDKEVISNLFNVIEQNVYPTYNELKGWDLQVAIAHNALSKDVKLYDWMSTQPSPVCVSYYKGHIAVSIPRVWYDRFLIDSERDRMAEIQCMNLFLHYVGNEHASFQDFSSYSRFKGEDIILQKQIKQGFTFNIAFQKNHIVRVYMECPKEQDCFVLQSNMSLQSKVEKNRLYLDIDDTDNLNPKFTYYLLKDYLTSVSSEIYQIYKLAESSTNY